MEIKEIREINKIISEYMFPDEEERRLVALHCDVVDLEYWCYAEVLDALIPVWTKLHEENDTYETIQLCIDYTQVVIGQGHACCGDGQISLQQAAAKATALCIKELA